MAVHQDNFTMEIGKLLKSLRVSQGLTLEALANDAGTDEGNLSRIERGVQKPNLEVVERIASALQIRMSALYLMIEGGDTTKLTDLADSETAKLARGFRGLSSDNKSLAIDFLKLLKKRQEKQG